jgi:hypothetical protein
MAQAIVEATVRGIVAAINTDRRQELTRTAKDAAAEHKSGGHAYGYPELTKTFGEDIAGKVAEWLDYHGGDDERLSTEHQSAAKPSPWHYHTPAASAPVPALIKGLLPETGAGILAGQWGTYKTTVALDISLAVMTQPLFAERFRVKRQGAVAYLAPEGAGGLSDRLNALAGDRGMHLPLPFAWRGDCPALTSPNAIKTLVPMVQEAAASLKQQFNLPLVLIWIDTIIVAAQYAKAGDDNDAAVTQKVMSVLSDLSRQTGAFVIGIDHFGKVVDTGTRGSINKESHADTVLALLADREINGSLTNTRLAIRKQRDGIAGIEIPFSPKMIDCGLDEDGDPVTKTAIIWNTQPIKPADAAWSKSLRLLRQVLMTMLVDAGTEVTPFADGPTVRAVNIETVRGEFYKQYPADGDEKQKAETRRKAFGRAIKDAQAKHLVALREINNVQLIWLATPAA